MPIFRLILAACFVAITTLPAAAHQERPVTSPPRPGSVPDIARVNPNSIVVCKPTSKPTSAQLAEIQNRIATTTGDELVQAQKDLAAWERNTQLFDRCCFEHIQDAVNAAGNDTDILVMPGLYREEPSRVCPETSTGDLSGGGYSYEYQAANPHDQNLIAIVGKSNITVEGTGGKPEDVLIDGGFAKDVGVRCDRCAGFIIRNLWLRDVNEHGIYVIESDGFIFDRTRGSYAKDYELFSFASDHGLYTDCEAEGGGDSGLYTGGNPITPGRFAVEIRRCKMHHNALGFSGTQGSYVWMHDNDFYDNAIGISYDSETDHPNFPERFSLIENNRIFRNNLEIYDADTPTPAGGPAYSFFRYPVGTGMWLIGGDDNVIRNNYIYDNKRMGIIIARNPLEQPTPEEPGVSAVNRNQIYGNIIGRAPSGALMPNTYAFPPGGDYAKGGSDLWWDETGNDNCWGPQDPSSGPIITDPPNSLNPLGLPGPCPSINIANPAGNALKVEILANCALDGGNPPHTNDVTYPCPWGQTNNAPYQNLDERECGNSAIDLGEDCDPGYSPWPVDLNGESCQSLGHGNGDLACKPDCTFDFSGCDIGNNTCGQASACGSYFMKKLRMRLVGTPGTQTGVLKATIDGTGHPFDPRVEEVAVILRDQTGLIHSATIPAGNGRWSARPVSNPSRYIYRDAAGTIGGIARITLRAASTNGFGNFFSADVRLKGADLTGASNATAATATLRLGNDCWEEAGPCRITGGGRMARCQTAVPTLSCPAP